MRTNPFFNAVLAAAYIWCVGLLVNYISSIRHDTSDTLTDSVAFLSLLVCSVAVMAFLFFYGPAVLLIENKKVEAISYFLKTIVTFGVLTLIPLIFVLF